MTQQKFKNEKSTRKDHKPQPTHICTYINSRGDTRVKLFASVDAGLTFCDILDQRIKRGTCGGYTLTSI